MSDLGGPITSKICCSVMVGRNLDLSARHSEGCFNLDGKEEDLLGAMVSCHRSCLTKSTVATQFFRTGQISGDYACDF